MSEGADPALIGRRIAGKFVIEQFLGGGAMGALYRARDDSLDRKVALKVMHPAVAVDPTFVTRFHREARAASRLEHPNSVGVIAFGEEPDGLLYIAMEYLEGRDLYKVIHEDWPLSDTRIADVVMKCLAAMAVAHEMGVIHRDLKPENIMILNRKDDEGHDLVKVCDFGIAKLTEKDDDGAPKSVGAKLTTSGVLVGTPEYMSPEQARGEKLDARSDLYSMGIILYQLLTGRTPFLADTAVGVVLKHITEQPEAPRVIYPGVHQGLEAVCLRALAKAKEDRFQTAREMRGAVKAAIEGRPFNEANISAPPPRMPSEPSGAGKMPEAPKTAPMSARTLDELTRATADSPKQTPLGTSLETRKEKRSRAPLVLLLLLVLGAAAVVVAQRKHLINLEGILSVVREVTTGATTVEPPKPASAGNAASIEPPASATPPAADASSSQQ